MTTSESIMLLFTGIIAATGMVGAFIFSKQLSAMRGQLEEMKSGGEQTRQLVAANQDLAVAAKQAAETEREALVTSRRAFVRLDGWPWLWRRDAARPGKYFYDISPVILNAGDTPTREATIVVQSAFRDTELPPDFDFAYSLPPGSTLIGPRQTIRAHNVEILDEDLLAVQKGEKFFYIWGTVSYRDVFEGTRPHVTEFATQINRVVGNPLDPRDIDNPKGATVEIYFSIYPGHQRMD